MATDTWARNLLQKKVLRAAGARRQPFPAHVPCPAVGTPPTAGQQGRGLGDPCRVYRVVCQALPLPERARPALACGLHYYERRSNMRPAARGAPFLYVGRT
ncbi:MAG TPA: hypothetical protein VI542_17585 [Candidatus Tectomicrobia bacterium]